MIPVLQELRQLRQQANQKLQALFLSLVPPSGLGARILAAATSLTRASVPISQQQRLNVKVSHQWVSLLEAGTD